MYQTELHLRIVQRRVESEFAEGVFALYCIKGIGVPLCIAGRARSTSKARGLEHVKLVTGRVGDLESACAMSVAG